ncbi:MAG: hypothetical protein EOP00_24000 [Pedobacter sp.]|nr:MAG: hypothetical protein EOP00_24000 [Pedobacter sp.]
MKILRVLLIILILSGCEKHESKKFANKKEVTDSDIYEIVNLVVKDADNGLKKEGIKRELYKYLLDRDYYGEVFNRADSTVFTKSDTVFSKEDLKFIAQQIKKRKKFKFKQEYIREKVIISADTIQRMLEKKLTISNYDFYKAFEIRFGNTWYYTIGLPVFSLDKKTAFIKLDGFGSGHSMIYKKINGKWKLHCIISGWIA